MRILIRHRQKLIASGEQLSLEIRLETVADDGDAEVIHQMHQIMYFFLREKLRLIHDDAGIFLLDSKPYFLGIFTLDGPALDGEDHQQKLIGQLSRMVYDYMK